MKKLANNRTTGQVSGLLCRGCHHALAPFHDDAAIFVPLDKYEQA